MIKVSQPLPNFKINATNNASLHLDELKNKNVVLYFYPKDDTPGCTTEGQDFRDNFDQFKQLNTIIFGISRDHLQSHEKFKSKFKFPFELISDPDETLCRLFDVIKLKNMYGKQVNGIERSTFLVDKEGILRKEWRKVKVKGHVDEVLAAVKSLNNE